jgi:hypothetical protein
MRNGDMVVRLGNHLVDRGHSPGVEITADGEFGVLRILLCGFNAARSVKIGLRGAREYTAYDRLTEEVALLSEGTPRTRNLESESDV